MADQVDPKERPRTPSPISESGSQTKAPDANDTEVFDGEQPSVLKKDKVDKPKDRDHTDAASPAKDSQKDNAEEENKPFSTQASPASPRDDPALKEVGGDGASPAPDKSSWRQRIFKLGSKDAHKTTEEDNDGQQQAQESTLHDDTTPSGTNDTQGGSHQDNPPQGQAATPRPPTEEASKITTTNLPADHPPPSVKPSFIDRTMRKSAAEKLTAEIALMDHLLNHWRVAYDELVEAESGALRALPGLVQLGEATNKNIKLKGAWCLDLGKIPRLDEEAHATRDNSEDLGRQWFLRYHMFVDMTEKLRVLLNNPKLKCHFQSPDFTDAELKWLKAQGHMVTKKADATKKATSKSRKYFLFALSLDWDELFSLVVQKRPTIILGTSLSRSQIEALQAPQETAMGATTPESLATWVNALEDLHITHNHFPVPPHTPRPAVPNCDPEAQDPQDGGGSVHDEGEGEGEARRRRDANVFIPENTLLYWRKTEYNNPFPRSLADGARRAGNAVVQRLGGGGRGGGPRQR